MPRDQEVNLNLIPIMNLFTALIPFLLLSAAFYHLAVIQVTVPTVSEGETDVAKAEDKITLNLRVTKQSFELSASSDTLGPDVLANLKASVPRPAGGENADKDAAAAALDALRRKAFEIKGSYDKSDTVIVVPDPKVAYAAVIDALDAVREISLDEQGQRRRVRLFPRVVLSSMVSADAGGEKGD